ncbi:TlpA family protein disulfide reductase [Anaerovorax odorimutans]|uniref:TlpA family protein disulfide reductase n=1 Tax=Anaerovorax odorimutans TaxID=109327 RepID=UPI0003FC56FF|nr:TlpA disulfide reductase family protein [Anaerovorax odorimutans]
MKKLLLILLICSMSTGLLTGCYNSDENDSTNTVSPTPSSPEAVKNSSENEYATDVNKNAATQLGDFKAQDVNGKEITNDIFSDYDLTLVNLFATFCSPCIEEMPYLNAIDKEMADKKVNVIGIVLDVNEDGKIDDAKFDKLKKIIESTKAEYDILLPDEVLRQGRLKGVNTVPESFFVDKEGNIVGETYSGSHSKDEWIKIIENELAKLNKQ